MAIHTRRPQDPPDMPKITIGSGPGLPPIRPGADAEAAAVQAARAAEAEAARAAALAPVAGAVKAGATGATTGAPGVTRDQEWVEKKRGPVAPSGGHRMWLVTLAAGLISMIASIFAPPSARPVLLGITAALVAVGVALYFGGPRR